MTTDERLAQVEAENAALRRPNRLLEERDRLRSQQQALVERLNDVLQARVAQLEARVQALEAIGILPRFRGVSGHDGWTAYGHDRRCRHALCNAHHLRKLTFVEEELHQAWAGTLKHLLREVRTAVEQARAAGAQQIPTAQREAFRIRYEALLAEGLAANPQPPPPAAAANPAPRRRGRHKQSPARNLLDRLWTYEHEVLWFLDDFAVPFDSNQAERDLRMGKVQQKISGTFRSPAGAQVFRRGRSVLSTWRKQGRSALDALDRYFVKVCSKIEGSATEEIGQQEVTDGHDPCDRRPRRAATTRAVCARLRRPVPDPHSAPTVP